MNVFVDDPTLDPDEIREVFQRVFQRDVRSVQCGSYKKKIFGKAAPGEMGRPFHQVRCSECNFQDHAS